MHKLYKFFVYVSLVLNLNFQSDLNITLVTKYRSHFITAIKCEINFSSIVKKKILLFYPVRFFFPHWDESL